MHEQGIVAHTKKEIFATAIHALDPPANESARQIAWNRPSEPMVVDPHRGHFLPFYVRSHAPPRRFNLRELGHGAVCGGAADCSPADYTLRWQVCRRDDPGDRASESDS
jgi:hypothetical protein